MKRIIVVLLIIALVPGLIACSNSLASNAPTNGNEGNGETNAGNGKLNDNPDKDNTDFAVFTAKIARLDGETAVLAGIGEDGKSSGLCTLSLKDLAITDESGQSITYEELAAGMVVEIKYSGLILESYPVQLGGPFELNVAGREEDYIGFYLGVIEDLYETDPGLNADISVLAFDLNDMNMLSAPEKEALIWLAGNLYGMEAITGTFDELCEQGYIDRENLCFETGLLIRIEDKMINDKRFGFNIEKWRSGLGAYYFYDCVAEKTDGVWAYTVGQHMVS